MSASDVVGLLCGSLMSLAFIAARSRAWLFNVLSGGLLTAAGIAVLRDARSWSRANAVALLAGLSLYWIGLLILRAMLVRSVSLQLLIASSERGRDVGFNARIAQRLDEAVQYRLARAEGSRLSLTPLGAAVAFALSQVDRLPGPH